MKLGDLAKFEQADWGATFSSWEAYSNGSQEDGDIFYLETGDLCFILKSKNVSASPGKKVYFIWHLRTQRTGWVDQSHKLKLLQSL